MKSDQFIGRQLVGMPGSRILSMSWAANEGEDWAAGSPVYLVTVRLNDGREVVMAKSWRSLEQSTTEGTRP